MGPRRSRRGLPAVSTDALAAPLVLQWVHGARAVVYLAHALHDRPLSSLLQWVHGARAVVYIVLDCELTGKRRASMGPRRSRRGLPDGFTTETGLTIALQWVHGARAV